MEIRRETIAYSALKKRNRIKDEQLLNHDIEILEFNLQQNPIPDLNLQQELDDKKAALETIYNYQAQGAYVRSRANHKVEGERPSRMFCALEKYNGTQKYVPQLIVSSENNIEKTIDDQKEIEAEILGFYKKLYECKDDLITIDSINDFIGPEIASNDIPKLKEDEKIGMEGKITLEEMSKCLKRAKNNVAPGASGFTNEFFKFFWRDLKHFVINSVDYAFENNRRLTKLGHYQHYTKRGQG